MNECGEKNEKEGDEMEVERRVRFNSGNNKSKLMTPDSCTQVIHPFLLCGVPGSNTSQTALS